MTTLSKIVITVAAAIGIALAAAAYSHGPGSGYGQGMGMMGPQGGGAGTSMHGMYGGRAGSGMHGMHGGGAGTGMYGMHGGGAGTGMHGMYGGGAGTGMHGMYGGGAGGGMHGMSRGEGGAGPCTGPETIGARLDALESELKLTAEQTQAWEAFKSVVRTQMQTMAEAHPHWSQDENEHIAFMEQRLEGMKAVQKARTELYNVLTPEQKATAGRYGIRGPRV